MKFSRWCMAAIAGVYLAMALPQINKQLVYDEADFAKGAAGILETGLPKYNRGFINDYPGVNEGRFQFGFFHPPLYMYTLAGGFALLGTHDWSARLVGIICGLITLFLTYRISRKLLEINGQICWFSFLPPLLCAVNPYFIQSTLLLDIDGSIQLLLITLFFTVHYALIDKSYKIRFVPLILIFILTMWSKITTVLAIPCALGAAALLSGNGKRLGEAFLIGLVGSLVWLGSWILYATAFHFDPKILWQFHGATSQEALLAWDEYRINFVQAALVNATIPWVTPLFFVLVLGAGLWRLWKFITNPRIHSFDGLFFFGYVVFFYYLIKLAGGFPKYHIPAIPCLAICIALALKDIGGKLEPIEFQSIWNWMSILLFGTLTCGSLIFGYWFASKKYQTSLPKENLLYFLMGFGLSIIFPVVFLLKKNFPPLFRFSFLTAALILGGFSYGFFVINDTWLNSRYHLRDNLPPAVLSDWAQAALPLYDEVHPNEFDKESKQYDGLAWSTLRRFFYLLNIIPLATMGIAVLATPIWHWKTIIPRLATATLLISLGMALALSVKQTFSDYSVTYFYGDKGIKDAAHYLNQKSWEGMFVAEGEVAYYMNNKNYVEIDRYMQSRRIHNAEGELFIDAEDLPQVPIHLFIARKWIEDFWPGQDYEITKEFGSFRIIEYKPRSKKAQKS